MYLLVMYCFLQNRTSEGHLQFAPNTNGDSSQDLRYQDPSTIPIPMYTEGSGYEPCPALTKPSSPGIGPAHCRTEVFCDEPRQVMSTVPDCERPNTSASLSRNTSSSTRQVSPKSGPRMVDVGPPVGAAREQGPGMKRGFSRPMQVEVPSPSHFSDEAQLARTDKHGPANPGLPPGILNAAVARFVCFIEFVCICCAYYYLVLQIRNSILGCRSKGLRTWECRLLSALSPMMRVHSRCLISLLSQMNPSASSIFANFTAANVPYLYKSEDDQTIVVQNRITVA